ncbi:hypothetical protein P7K49_025154 [Saguinus oedipus]|uniref:Uncharacterized protein n=1 Tax=Saguinus oedipus TaxID=9490 RepID=A0ABQ9UHA1_SAGOE|nr:hypothetical protein P7K49_025154 [Saguinus oedipus]
MPKTLHFALQPIGGKKGEKRPNIQNREVDQQGWPLHREMKGLADTAKRGVGHLQKRRYPEPGLGSRKEETWDIPRAAEMRLILAKERYLGAGSKEAEDESALYSSPSQGFKSVFPGNKNQTLKSVPFKACISFLTHAVEAASEEVDSAHFSQKHNCLF